jgi:hypothetical protein
LNFELSGNEAIVHLIKFLWTHAIVSHCLQGTAAKSKETKVAEIVYTSSIVHEPNDLLEINLADEGSDSDDDKCYFKVRMKKKKTPAAPFPE